MFYKIFTEIISNTNPLTTFFKFKFITSSNLKYILQ